MSRAAVSVLAFAFYLFGVVDLACAAWTFLAPRADAATAPVRT
jgi:hypothetical protein